LRLIDFPTEVSPPGTSEYVQENKSLVFETTSPYSLTVLRHSVMLDENVRIRFEY
jgi:hypothetical protein